MKGIVTTMMEMINQNAAEICNGYDDDCDGFIDIEDSNWDSSSNPLICTLFGQSMVMVVVTKIQILQRCLLSMATY